jgi:hypothetical protein
MHDYLTLQDSHFQARPKLWLRDDGTVPTRQWFIANLQHLFPKPYSGQSMHAGSATMLAEDGVSPPLIQAAGHWTLETFNQYIQKNSFLFKVLLTGRAPHTL